MFAGAPELATGDRINDRYELEERLGRGGMGEVWRARHLALKSYVAIKFLHAAPAQQESARKRFVTEAQLTAQIKTRHAVQVFDFGVTEAGRPFIVMELLDGETVGHRLERLRQLPRAATVRFLQQAARALDRAHALGIVHRDFKPDNLVIVKDEDGRESIKVLDFGIAKLLGELEALSMPPASQGDDTLVDGDAPPPSSSLTSTNAILGTPHYMAPEQIRRDEPGPAIDIWAFGVVAFECLCGTPPFDGTSLLEIFTRIQTGRHLSARELAPELPAEFEDWFALSCSLEPAARFRSATVAARALAVSLESARWGNDRPSLASTGSGPVASEGSAATAVPRATLTSARLLARRPREVGDTHAPVSRGVPGPALADAPPSPLPPAPSERPSSRAPLASLRPPRPRPPWALAAFAAAALVMAGGFLAWRALNARPADAGPLAAPAAEVRASASGAPVDNAQPVPSGPASSGPVGTAGDGSR